MFAVADIVGVVVLQERLQHLRKHPNQLNYILSPFTKYAAIRDMVGAEYIDQITKWVLENAFHVAPYYQHDMQKMPSVVFVHRTNEAQLYLGDYGSEGCQEIVSAPVVYSEFDIVGTDGKNVLYVPAAYEIEKKLWRNVFVKNAQFYAQVTGIHPRPDQDTMVILDKDVPEGIAMRGWTSQSAEKLKGFQINASTDDTELVAKLTTHGDYSIHRLAATVIRYCFKSARLNFDDYGFQNARINQGMPVLTDDTQKVYETVFTISGKYTDHWIAKEFEVNDPSDKLEEGFIACNGETQVVLE